MGKEKKIIIDGDVSIGSVVSYYYSDKKAELTINEGKTLKLEATNDGKDSSDALIFKGNYTNLGNITIGNGSKLVVKLPTTLSGKIDGAVDKAGNLDIQNDAIFVIFEEDIGSEKQLEKIEVKSRAEAIFEKAVNAEKLIVEGYMIAEDQVSANNIMFKKDQSKLTIAGNNTTVTGAINGGSDDYGILEFTGEGSKVEGAVGEDTKLLKEVNFINNGVITGNVYAKNINVEESKKATLGGIVHAENGLRLRGATSIVSFLNNTTVDSQINGNGIVEF